MRTTVDIDDDLLAKAKALAMKERRSVRSLIEEGLRKILKPKSSVSEAEIDLPVSKAKGGLRPGVDLNSSLRNLMAAEDEQRYGHTGR